MLGDEETAGLGTALELELIQTQMTQKPMLRVEVGARALRNPVGRGGGAARVFACGGGWYRQASTPRRGGARALACAVGPQAPRE